MSEVDLGASLPGTWTSCGLVVRDQMEEKRTVQTIGEEERALVRSEVKLEGYSSGVP